MILQVKVVYQDGTEKTYPVTARTEVELERHFQKAMSELNSREHVYFAGWLAAGKDGAFETWLDRVADAELDVDSRESPPDPTRPDSSGTSSP